jgi:hypothetical protein
MSTRIIIVILSFAIPFALSLSYPLALLLYLPKSTHPSRWIQNNPSFSVFLLSSFPIAVCIFALTVNFEVVDHWLVGSSWHVWVAYPALALTLIIVTLIVFDDFMRRPMAPYILKRRAAQEAAGLEKELRAAFGHHHKQLEAKCRAYQKMVRLGSLRAIRQRAGPIAYIHLALAWLATLFALTYFWYLVAASEFKLNHGAVLGKGSEDKLVLILILLMTWFPLRLHTEWYQSYFHKKDWLKQYPAFWLLAFLAFALLVLVMLIVRPTRIIQFISLLNVIFVGILGLVGKLKPQWLRAVGDFVQAASFVYFLAIYLIFLVLIAAVSAGAVWLAT